MDTVLGLMAKEPVAGRVKTRLAAGTSPAFAARVAEAFLLDQLERLQVVAARRLLVYDPPAAAAYFRSACPPGWELSPQTPGDLGTRLRAIFAAQFDRGAHAVVLVGTDSPTLPMALIAAAFERLADHDLVLGPATDGGYYLIGLRQPKLTLFEGIDWGTATVLAQTVARLEEGARLALLPPWYDVDTLDDWQALAGHLAALIRAGTDPGLPRTRHLVSAYGRGSRPTL
jgi:hypothetical protein